MTEAELHRQVADYLSLALPVDAFWTTFPAGGGGIVRGAKLKRSGLRAGVPDIYIGYGSGNFWIELKAIKGRLAPAQITCHDEIKKAGGHVAVCRSLDDVIGSLRGWGVPLQASAA